MEDEDRWNLPTLVAFRFAVLYLGAFCLTFAQITFVFTGLAGQWLPPHAVLAQMLALQPLTSWVGRTVFGVDAVLDPASNSGDQTAAWLLVFTLAVLAAVGTLVWSVADRSRPAYPRLAAWFLVFVRLCLGGQMLFYGFAKLIPTQMPAPPLAALLEPFGDLSPMSVLWLQVGTSAPYEMFLGAVEVIAGVLLFVPRTATAGALLALAGTGQIFLLNMTFDVPVKILSSHLLLMSLVLLAPGARRLVDALVLGRGVGPAPSAPLFDAPRRDRAARVAQVLLGAWVTVSCAVFNAALWHQVGDGRAKPPLYGIWTVTDFTSDGKTLPPLLDDEFRWQRVVFDVPGVMTQQRMDGDLVDVPVTVDGDVLTIGDTGQFTVERADDDLRLRGTLDGKAVDVRLHRQRVEDFTLRSRGFHWVQERPFFG